MSNHINTSYGNFTSCCNDAGGVDGIDSYVESALDNHPGIDTAAVARDFAAAINAALPDSVQLCGDEFYGPAGFEVVDFEADGFPVDDDGALDIGAIIEGVDFWAIVESRDAEREQAVDAETLAEMIAAKLGTVRGPCRDGAYSVDTSETVDATGVWRLYVGDDPSPDAPCGISWSLDGPDERGEQSGGWEMLPKHQAAAEAATLAGYLDRKATPKVAGGMSVRGLVQFGLYGDVRD